MNCAYSSRHLGPRPEEISGMLARIGVTSLDELIDKTIPANIRLKEPLKLPDAVGEHEYLNLLREMLAQNQYFRTFIGLGYYGTLMPAVIQRNILENPSWYTSYTPYQAEVSQGRLEALLNFQTMVCSLTGMDIANASLLDEAQSAAEAMIMSYNLRPRDAVKRGANVYFVDEKVFPQTLDVLLTRSAPLGIELMVGDAFDFELDGFVFGALIQYPDSDGSVRSYANFVAKAHESVVLVTVVADIMALALLTPPGEWGADIVVGNTQRFGLPMGYGGPHAAFFATRDAYKRQMPGRIIGVSMDASGRRVLRMALQTREQHIKREKATSNICTSQALLATMAGMYAVYHGPEGIKNKAKNMHRMATSLSMGLQSLGYTLYCEVYFDTIKVAADEELCDRIRSVSERREMNFRYFADGAVGMSMDETTTLADICAIVGVFAEAMGKGSHTTILPAVLYSLRESARSESGMSAAVIPAELLRSSPVLTQKVFNRYHSETEMMRYIKKLERKDISLTHSMIPLGSCTMKLNAATAMMPLSWPSLDMHPFVPSGQVTGYRRMIEELADYLALITGFEAVSFQPNSGASGEYAGLMVIREYHLSRGDSQRNVVLIPSSAHGTNPASAAMAGMEIVTIPCDDSGNIDVAAFKASALENAERLSATMITYPSTHGVFEESIRDLTGIVHRLGGLVYMDGANMNAQVGLTSPGMIGADVCHLNLHKTFAIPHGGGGPGVGPICVNEKLKPFLPSHSVVDAGGERGITAVSAAPFGSASILSISHAYIRMMGRDLMNATKYAILNANYLAAVLKDSFPVLYTNHEGMVAHEMILDCRPAKQESGITEGDIAKRLMDYGFHAPTVSFPVHGTLMIEPTESESLQELDRFAYAMRSIAGEINEVASGAADKSDNVLKNAPHCEQSAVADVWGHAYAREKAAYPLDWIRENKFWPGCDRVDDAYGDRNLVSRNED